jgi:glutathionylspermidine amidase/synthetase
LRGNVSLFGHTDALIEETGGQFRDRDQIYQELFPLARSSDLYVQPSTFVVAGAYAASAARVDESLVITDESENVPLRVVAEGWFRGLPDRSPT